MRMTEGAPSGQDTLYPAGRGAVSVPLCLHRQAEAVLHNILQFRSAFYGVFSGHAVSGLGKQIPQNTVDPVLGPDIEKQLLSKHRIRTLGTVEIHSNKIYIILGHGIELDDFFAISRGSGSA